jgi:hypothetical protein
LTLTATLINQRIKLINYQNFQLDMNDFYDDDYDDDSSSSEEYQDGEDDSGKDKIFSLIDI